ncbi:MAG: class I SAM-dependent methyltransferase [Oscillospiraceae bacterium]|nr:class I SAM-dependent methyltransferase [Oscillospiraceae bacterium]
MLNSLSNSLNPNWELFSIDCVTQVGSNPPLPVGYCAIERYSGLQNDKWHLLTGIDPAVAMETINRKFDFCVIDTEHRHPIETLNFISILPYLNDGAIVVVHDISIFMHGSKTNPQYIEWLAPRLLLSAVCADKYIPKTPGVPNIAAFQVNADTRKYCQNLFDVLYLPWKTDIGAEVYSSTKAIVEKHYGEKMLRYFEEAVRINYSIPFDDKYYIRLREAFDRLSKDTVFYGAGYRMRCFIRDLEFADTDIKFNFPIWDIAADKIGQINGHPVTLPDIKSPAAPGQIMIIMIYDRDVADKLRAQFEPLGYRVFHGVGEYMVAR